MRQTWHHGLVARWWAEFNVASDEELVFYRSAIAQYGQPVLDLGCGTGRMLLPLIRSGIDVDGCDVSPDMLAHCRAQAMRAGHAPQLFEQSGDDLALPRKYGTIYICDSFGTVGGAEALRRCHEHLLPSGALVFNVTLPYAEADRWRFWIPEESRSLPEPWPESGERRRAADGDEIELRSRRIAFDPLEQMWTREIQATLLHDGEVVTREEHILHERSFFRNELVLMLRHTGFSEVVVSGAYDGRPARSDDLRLVIAAHK
jgi:SAM-dependent methyltransferase